MHKLKKITEKAVLDCAKELKSSNSSEIWRVKIDGAFITMPSKKSSWQKIGHAKNALRNAMIDTITCNVRNTLRTSGRLSGYSYLDLHDEIERAYQSFLKEHVEFIKS